MKYMQPKHDAMDGEDAKVVAERSKKRPARQIAVDPVEQAEPSAASKRSKGEEEDEAVVPELKIFNEDEALFPELKIFDKDEVVGAPMHHHQRKMKILCGNCRGFGNHRAVQCLSSLILFSHLSLLFP